MGQEQAGETAPARRVGCLRRSLYFVIVGLLIFGVFVGTFYFVWYRPVALQNQTLQAEVEDLRPLQGENEELRSQVEQASLRLLVLQALVDINAARASLALGQRDQATESLSSAGARLQELAFQVGSADATEVGQMRDRLGLALGEIGDDAFAAQSDLDVLANDLSQLAERLSLE